MYLHNILEQIEYIATNYCWEMENWETTDTLRTELDRMRTMEVETAGLWSVAAVGIFLQIVRDCNEEFNFREIK